MKLLDLYCGAGGAAMGYWEAGWDVVGVDIEAHADFPFTFIQADALDVLTDADFLSRFAAVHASPPCQAHTTMSNRYRGNGGSTDDHLDLIGATRELLIAGGLPYVIENVDGARAKLRDPIRLTGGMFGLGVERPRLFESNVALTAPHYVRCTDPIGVYGRHHDGRRLWTRNDGSVLRCARTLAEGQEAMGIDWMSWPDLTEAIPPAYTHHVGGQLLEALRTVAA